MRKLPSPRAIPIFSSQRAAISAALFCVLLKPGNCRQLLLPCLAHAFSACLIDKSPVHLAIQSAKIFVKKRASRYILEILGTMLFVYSGTYFWLSLHGRYEPMVVGWAGVKNYMWAPRGFVDDFVWNEKLMSAFTPLFFIDTRLWHTSRKAREGKYPINEVSREEIGRVYEAWMR